MRTAPATVVSVACLAVVVDNIAYTMSFACLPHMFEDKAMASESQLGLASTMFGVGSFVTSVLSGIISDRTRSRKLPMIVGATGYALCGVILFFSSKLHHILLYRLVNGLASGCNYPIATSTVGDVYPSRLLGLQMALVNTFANVGYTIGPVMGGALYDSVGIRGVSAVLMCIGCVLGVVVLVAIAEPLTIRSHVLESQKIPSEKECQVEIADYWPQSLDKSERDEKQVHPQFNKSNSSSDSDSSTVESISDKTIESSTAGSAQSMALWRLVFQWQVLAASVTTLVVGMVAGSLENVLPIYIKDQFGASASKTGLLFVVNGSMAIALSTPIGWISDRQIKKHGERMRAYIELFGLGLMTGAIALLAFSTSFGMTIGAQVWFAAGLIMVNVPVMSSFGDFVNALGLNSMAQSYGLYNSFWSLSSTIAPPIATALYTRIGYRATVVGVLTGLCAVCAAVVLFVQPLVRKTR
ncbi:hypothetical protein H4217_000239 [Coemansia sp. RSA 1939]|nr:hypothetical protein H4217_000239 [Coemansia sp. RSA 1939]KAJ2617912.1 hypothetical protein EV177_000289 [Coemansia sp. RSA 1804]